MRKSWPNHDGVLFLADSYLKDCDSILVSIKEGKYIVLDQNCPMQKVAARAAEYAKTKDILGIMKMLGHKSLQNMLLYTQLVNSEKDEFHSATGKAS
jgi:hypothetical protein